MQFRFIQPHKTLQNYVKHYCFMESEACEADVSERVIPTESIQLMFHYRQPFVVLEKNRIVSHQPRSIISGLSNTFSDVSTYGYTGVVFVAFQPAGACMFFRFPLSEIENQSVDMKEFFNKEISEVEEQLFLFNNFEERATIIDLFLLNKMEEVKSHDFLLIRESMRLIKQSHGQTDSYKLSSALYTTQKNLERKFSSLIGKTPKQFIKIIRFQSVIDDISTRRNINLTELAYRNGYADQSHFIRDFKAFSGFTPKEFISRYPNCQLNCDFDSF